MVVSFLVVFVVVFAAAFWLLISERHVRSWFALRFTWIELAIALGLQALGLMLSAGDEPGPAYFFGGMAHLALAGACVGICYAVRPASRQLSQTDHKVAEAFASFIRTEQ